MKELEYSRNENLDNFYSDLLNELDFSNTEIILSKIKNIQELGKRYEFLCQKQKDMKIKLQKINYDET